MIIDAVKPPHQFGKTGSQLLFSCLAIRHAVFLWGYALGFLVLAETLQVLSYLC